MILTESVDGTILVVEANRTPKRAIQMAIKKLRDTGSEITGIVLNKQVNYVPAFVQNLIDTL